MPIITGFDSANNPLICDIRAKSHPF